MIRCRILKPMAGRKVGDEIHLTLEQSRLLRGRGMVERWRDDLGVVPAAAPVAEAPARRRRRKRGDS